MLAAAQVAADSWLARDLDAQLAAEARAETDPAAAGCSRFSLAAAAGRTQAGMKPHRCASSALTCLLFGWRLRQHQLLCSAVCLKAAAIQLASLQVAHLVSLATLFRLQHVADAFALV